MTQGGPSASASASVGPMADPTSPSSAASELPSPSTSKRDRRSIDRYGFIIDDFEGGTRPAKGSRGSQLGAGPSSRSSRGYLAAAGNGADSATAFTAAALEASREKKWGMMLDSWESFADSTSASPSEDAPASASALTQTNSSSSRRMARKRRETLRKRIRKGVPHGLRGVVWAKLGGAQSRVEVTDPGEYTTLVALSARVGGESDKMLQQNGSHAKSTHDGSNDISSDEAIEHSQDRDLNRVTPRATQETIERDIYRTFPRHYMFAESSEEEVSDEASSPKSPGDNNSDLDSSGHLNRDTLPARSKQLAEDGSSNLVAELDAIIGGGPTPSARTAAGSSKSSGCAPRTNGRSEFSLTTVDVDVPIEPDAPAAIIGTTLFDAMQKCNANLEQVDLGTLPAELILSAADGSLDPFCINAVAATEEGLGGNILTADAGATSTETSPRKLTREEKREQKKADYTGATGGQASLRRVLRAYSVYDPEVGYCQGMNFIAATFIAFMPEEEAFWTLVAAMNESPYTMRGLFKEGMSGAHEVLYVADKLVGQFLPRLSRHLERENVHITMYATQWLLTLYSSSFPFELVTRILDCFLAEGWKVVYRITLALLDTSSSDLMKLHFEDILGYFRELPLNIDSDAVFNRAFAIPLKRRHVERYKKEWSASQNR